MNRYQLDTRGLICPMPVIRTQNKIKELEPGDILEVTATDPGALHDIPTWCHLHGHKVLSATRDRHEVHITVRVGDK